MKGLASALVVGVVTASVLGIVTAPAHADAGCETPAAVAGTVTGEFADGGFDTWAYDVGDGSVVVNAVSIGGAISLFVTHGCELPACIYTRSCGRDEVPCSHYGGPGLTPVGGGTLFLVDCAPGSGFITVHHALPPEGGPEPSPTGTTHYALRLCAGSAAIGPIGPFGFTRFCPLT